MNGVPALSGPVTTFSSLGEITLGARIGVGEAALDTELRVRAGRYRVLLGAPEKGDEPMLQLLVVHAERSLADVDVGSLREGTRVAIDGARFTLADASLDEALHDMTGFYTYLDGVSGILRGGDGVSVTLPRSGEATVWIEAGESSSVVLVDIR